MQLLWNLNPVKTMLRSLLPANTDNRMAKCCGKRIKRSELYADMPEPMSTHPQYKVAEAVRHRTLRME